MFGKFKTGNLLAGKPAGRETFGHRHYFYFAVLRSFDLVLISQISHFLGNTDSIVIRFHSWVFIQSEETEGANSELFKENVDDTMYKNPYEI